LLFFLLRLFEALRRKLRLNVRNAEYYNLFFAKSQSVEQQKYGPGLHFII